jgi:hypothetical protein
VLLLPDWSSYWDSMDRLYQWIWILISPKPRLVFPIICNQCLSPLTLWVPIPLMATCTRYNIALSDRELRNKASLMIRVFPIRELKPGGLCYLSTCAKLYLEIGLNYSIICNLDRVMVFKATFNNISVRSWRSVLLVEDTGVLGENQRPSRK